MDDVLSCIKSVNGAFQCCISLAFAVTVFRILLIKLQIPLVDVQLAFRPVVSYNKGMAGMVRIVGILVNRLHLTLLLHAVPGPAATVSLLIFCEQRRHGKRKGLGVGRSCQLFCLRRRCLCRILFFLFRFFFTIMFLSFLFCSFQAFFLI